jgi:hypothetical protein
VPRIVVDGDEPARARDLVLEPADVLPACGDAVDDEDRGRRPGGEQRPRRVRDAARVVRLVGQAHQQRVALRPRGIVGCAVDGRGATVWSLSWIADMPI